MKIAVYNLREFDEKLYFDRCCAEYGYEYVGTPEYPSLENAELARGADAVCVIYCPIGRELLDRYHELGVRFLLSRPVGVDLIDLAHARELGIRVSHGRYSPDSVANYTIMLMLMSCRNIVRILRETDLQNFTLRGKIGRELSQCTVGVIGTGKIGAAVIRHLSGFGCRLLAFAHHQDDSLRGMAEYMELDKLLRESDIVTLHMAASADNRHLIDAAALAKMKEGAILVNTARGSLVDTDALIGALESGRLGGAALDVLEDEIGLYYWDRTGEVIRNREWNLLRSYPNVILSPHTAFYTDQVISDQVRNMFRSLRLFETGAENPLEVR